jgi:hypothetical protein
VKGRGQPLHDLRAVRLHPHAREGRLDRALEQLQVSVVTVVVLHDRLAQPPVVALDRRPVGLASGQRWVLAGEFGHPEEGEVELDGDRLLAP